MDTDCVHNLRYIHSARNLRGYECPLVCQPLFNQRRIIVHEQVTYKRAGMLGHCSAKLGSQYAIF
jgi:hypothetical protein